MKSLYVGLLRHQSSYSCSLLDILRYFWRRIRFCWRMAPTCSARAVTSALALIRKASNSLSDRIDENVAAPQVMLMGRKTYEMMWAVVRDQPV